VSPCHLAVLALLLAAEPGPAPSEAHLVAGAEAFRAEAYAQALVEFRVAEALGSTEASWYAAASLLKLGRSEDAVEAFVLAERSNRAAGDALLEVYRGQACYAGASTSAPTGGSSPPAAARGRDSRPSCKALRDGIRDALQPGQLDAGIDRLLTAATELAGTRPVLASAYADEAGARGPLAAPAPSGRGAALAGPARRPPPRGRR
jgi:hypothetical protein